MKEFWLGVIISLAIFLTACDSNANTTPTIPPGTPPPEASATFQKILADCWGVADMKEIDSKKPAHLIAFDCARERLLKLGQDYPNFAEAHRVLGWGYNFKNHDEAAARAEYQRAAEIYHTQGKTVDEADMYRRLGLLYMSPTDTTRGCQLFLRSLSLDPQNGETQKDIQSFFCLGTPTPTANAPIPSPQASPTRKP